MTLLLATILLATSPADTLTLSYCYRAAEENHPMQDAGAFSREIANLRLRGVDMRLYPSIGFGAQATYQSEVPSVPIPGALGGVSHDQYRAAVSIEQPIYTGGLTGVQRTIERMRGDLDVQETRVAIYGVRDQVDVAFFGALLQESVLATLTAARSLVAAEQREMHLRIREGVAPAGAADILQVELLRLEQQIGDAEAHQQAALSVLTTLTGLTVEPGAVLVADVGGEAHRASFGPDVRLRPEYAALDITRSMLGAQQSLAARKNRPQIGAVAEFAYGRPPGQNLFKDSFAPFFSVGLVARWSLIDWGQSGRDVGALQAQAGIIDVQERAFSRQLEILVEQQARDIDRLELLLAQDLQIIALRKQITQQASARLANGVATATDFMLEENAERQARLTMDLHTVQLGQARARLATTIGMHYEND